MRKYFKVRVLVSAGVTRNPIAYNRNGRQLAAHSATAWWRAEPRNLATKRGMHNESVFESSNPRLKIKIRCRKILASTIV